MLPARSAAARTTAAGRSQSAFLTRPSFAAPAAAASVRRPAALNLADEDSAARAGWRAGAPSAAAQLADTLLAGDASRLSLSSPASAAAAVRVWAPATAHRTDAPGPAAASPASCPAMALAALCDLPDAAQADVDALLAGLGEGETRKLSCILDEVTAVVDVNDPLEAPAHSPIAVWPKKQNKGVKGKAALIRTLRARIRGKSRPKG